MIALPRTWTKNGWTIWHPIMCIVMVGLGVFATIDAWKDIYALVSTDLATHEDEYTHVLLVPVVAVWLIWVRAGRFKHCRPHGQIIGPIIMLMGWAMYSLGDAMYVQAFWHAGAVVLALGCVYAVLGLDVFFAFLPALLVMAFLVPVPGRVRLAVSIPLENTTTAVTQNVCDLLGLAVTRSGNQLAINGREVEIAEACNGLRNVFGLVLVSVAFAFGLPLRWYVRLLIVAASPISAILCNVVRLVPTVYVYGYYSKAFADGFHLFAGWCLQPISLVLLIGIVSLLRWALVPINKFTLAYD